MAGGGEVGRVKSSKTEEASSDKGGKTKDSESI
jgi:hypothetical protein